MKEEFNLSEKILPSSPPQLYLGDVKEFIKKLKKETGNWNMADEFKGFIKMSYVHQIIDKLAGDKLK